MNILGLAAGLACSIIILLYVQSEVTYDDYHKDKDRIYRLGSRFNLNGSDERLAISSIFIGPFLLEEYEELESFCRMRFIPKVKVSSGPETYYEENFLWADSTAFDFFTTPMVYGDPATCLNKPNSIVLSSSIAQKYFGDKNPVGDTLITSNRYKYHVSGVFQDLPYNTHHHFSALLSYNTVDPHSYNPDSTTSFEVKKAKLWSVRDYTFLKFRPGATPEDFYAYFPQFYEKYMVKIGEKINGEFEPILEPLESIHLYSNLSNDTFQSGNRSYIYAFSVIGLFILVLAGINYVNMTTARSVTRTREVGLRKILGSRPRHLIFQFLGESLLLSTVALFLALGLVEMTLSVTPFNELMDKHLEMDLVGNPTLLMGSILISLILGLLSGLYPAFFLSSIQPAAALRRRTSKTGTFALRKGLVIFQFSISIAVIVSTFLMRNQIDFVRNMDLGFQTENICVIPVRDSLTKAKLPQIRETLESNPNILATTTAWGVPAHSVRRMLFWFEGGDSTFREGIVDFLSVGEDYLEGMDLKLLAGRNLKNVDTSVTKEVEFVVNETAAKTIFKGDPLGKSMKWGLNLGGMKQFQGKIVGVVQDFKFASLHEIQKPLVLLPQRNPEGMLHIRLKGEEIVETMAFVEKVWEPNEAEGSPFNPIFINEQFDRLYASDQRQSSLMGILAGICIVISILGLFGFASYSIEQRKREIGIRKVLGASNMRIVGMLIWEVFLLVLMASLIASILGYLAIQWWLSEFAYRAEISIGTFFIAGLIALSVAIGAILVQSIRAALSNPVLALKYE